MEPFPKTSRNQVKRRPNRGHYDRATIFSILDDGFVCHVGFEREGQPFVIPTAYGREGDILYIHGATGSRMLEQAKTGIPVCLTVTHLDGIVLARSAFHHSLNYRSAVIFGMAREVPEEDKSHALTVIAEQILRGRWSEVRPPTAAELKATAVLAIQIEEASAKIRVGPPVDDPEDYDLPVWAGVLPIKMIFEKAETDPQQSMQLDLPESVKRVSELP